jgi:hypothetical protein
MNTAAAEKRLQTMFSPSRATGPTFSVPRKLIQRCRRSIPRTFPDAILEP